MFQQNAVNRIRNETVEESSSGKLTVKIIFFDATIGSKNYTICKIDMRSIFLTDWGQPISLLTVLQEALFYNEQFKITAYGAHCGDLLKWPSNSSFPMRSCPTSLNQMYGVGF